MKEIIDYYTKNYETKIESFNEYLSSNQQSLKTIKTVNSFLETILIPLLKELQQALYKSEGSRKKFSNECKKILWKKRSNIAAFKLDAIPQPNETVFENLEKAQNLVFAIIKEMIFYGFIEVNLDQIRQIAYQLISKDLIDFVDQHMEKV